MKNKVELARKKSIWIQLYENRWIYIFILPGLIFLLVFNYWPMYGITLAFKEYKINLKIVGSPWAQPLFKNFNALFRDKQFVPVLLNTFRMGFFYILTGFPAPIILALLLNEVRSRYKKVLQIVYTFPNFLSWVIVGGLMVSFLANDGLINIVLRAIGLESQEILTNPKLIRPILYATSVWKSMGWSAIIYLAAISGIDPALYEAAEVDGANRFHKIWYITWPNIRSTAVILLILAFGGIMNNGFDQILNMVNPVVRDSAEILDTFIYRKSFQGTPNYGFSTAAGLFKSVLNFVFLLSADRIAKWLGEKGVM